MDRSIATAKRIRDYVSVLRLELILDEAGVGYSHVLWSRILDLEIEIIDADNGAESLKSSNRE
ncbi:MAG: hypothetical protein R3D26_13785 [Cyanobacteriota/Melainabacteria group bacterium]